MEYRNNEFPLEIFPEAIHNIILAKNEIQNWDINTFGCAFLSATATAIGTDVSINTTHWNDIPLLWFAVIGESGTSKSHILNYAFKVIQEIDDKNVKAFNSAHDQWMKKPKKLKDKTPEPKPVKFMMKNFTPEVIIQAHCNNPKGLVVFKDELAEWIKDFDKHKGGGEKEMWMSAWNGSGMSSDRIGRKSENVTSNCINLIGGIQPSKLFLIGNKESEDDGFLQRFLLVRYQKIKADKWSEKEVSKELDDDVYKLMKKVIKYPETKFTISKKSNSFFGQWYNEKNEQYFNNEFERKIQKKLETYVFRLCIVLEVLNQCANGEVSTELSDDSMLNAIKLIEFHRTEIFEALSEHKPLFHPLAKDLNALRVYKTLEYDKVYTNQELIKAFEGVWKVDNMNVRKLPNKDLFIPQKQGHYKKAYDDAE